MSKVDREHPSQSPPAAPRPAPEGGGVRHFVGSEVLDEVGTGGVAKRAMHEAVRTSDDEVSRHAWKGGLGASTSFRADPELGDAAAELAEELGRAMVESATRAEDVSELEIAYAEAASGDDSSVESDSAAEDATEPDELETPVVERAARTIRSEVRRDR